MANTKSRPSLPRSSCSVLTSKESRLSEPLEGLHQQPQPTAEVYNSDKTFIGRIERGFDFLGYYFGTDAPRHIPNEPSPRIKT